MAQELCFAGQGALLCKPIQRLPQKQCCPLTVVEFLCLPFCCSRDLGFRLCSRFIIQVLENHSAAAFQRPSVIAHVRDEMLQCTKQKGTKPSFLAIGAGICTSLDQVSEKPLGQIPRILWAISLSAQEGIKRAPINLAQFRECAECVSGNCGRIARFEDYCPACRGE